MAAAAEDALHAEAPDGAWGEPESRVLVALLEPISCTRFGPGPESNESKVAQGHQLQTPKPAAVASEANDSNESK